LAFESEVVALHVEDDSLRVEGTYLLACREAATGCVPLHYPYPADDQLGGARTVRLEIRGTGGSWEPGEFDEVAGGRGARWWIPLDRGPEIEVRTVYRQALQTRYARYIVTTTAAWGRPLRHARFEIHLPPGSEPLHFSHAFAPRDGETGRIYVYEETDFLPEQDIVVTWK
jgi:hypothetical protein